MYKIDEGLLGSDAAKHEIFLITLMRAITELSKLLLSDFVLISATILIDKALYLKNYATALSKGRGLLIHQYN